MSEGEANYAGVLVLTIFWAAISAKAFAENVSKEQRGWAWFWGASFAVASLVAAYCFGRVA